MVRLARCCPWLVVTVRSCLLSPMDARCDVVYCYLGRWYFGRCGQPLCPVVCVCCRLVALLCPPLCSLSPSALPHSRVCACVHRLWTQVLLLRAEKLRPVVIAGPPVTDFGAVHTGSVSGGATTGVVATVRLANPGQVDSEWELRHVPAPVRRTRVQFDPSALGLTGKAAAGLRLEPTPRDDDGVVDDPTVFSFATTSGVLKGTGLPHHGVSRQGGGGVIGVAVCGLRCAVDVGCYWCSNVARAGVRWRKGRGDGG